jgi:hypothetical protein
MPEEQKLLALISSEWRRGARVERWSKQQDRASEIGMIEEAERYGDRGRRCRPQVPGML